jgi:hypothetical protein
MESLGRAGLSGSGWEYGWKAGLTVFRVLRNCGNVDVEVFPRPREEAAEETGAWPGASALTGGTTRQGWPEHGIRRLACSFPTLRAGYAGVKPRDAGPLDPPGVGIRAAVGVTRSNNAMSTGR